jgi:hypothetical protein
MPPFRMALFRPSGAIVAIPTNLLLPGWLAKAAGGPDTVLPAAADSTSHIRLVEASLRSQFNPVKTGSAGPVFPWKTLGF